MAGTNDAGSPLEEAAGAAGPHVIEAFKLLGDETRLAILLALWEAYDPRAEGNVVSFTELHGRVSLEDSGNFAYHLDKLVDRFVEEADDGYRLSHTGHRIVRAVVAGTGLSEPSLPPTSIPRSCEVCGSTIEITYDDQRLLQVCTGCEGHLGPGSSLRTPPGTLVVHDAFDPAGLVDRTPAEVFVAGTIEYHRAATLVIRGICPECSGRMEASLRICEDHEAPRGEVCPTCGTCDVARVGYVCSVCKFSVSYPAWVAAFDHPAVVAFYHDHSFDGTFSIEDPQEAAHAWERFLREQELVSRDPVRIRVWIEEDDDVLELTLDGDLDVIEIEGRQPAARTRVGTRSS